MDKFENSDNEIIKFKTEIEETEAMTAILNLYPEFLQNFIEREPSIGFSYLLNEAEITPSELKTIIKASESITYDDVLNDKEIEYTEELVNIGERLKKVLMR
jgi:hypothetical protein